MKLFVLILASMIFLGGVQGGCMNRIRDIFARVRGGSSEAIEVATDKNVYAIGEKVVITIKNTGSTVLEGTPSYVVYDSSGKEVYSPMMMQTIRKLGVNESISFTWNQIDNNGKQIKEGMYSVEASFAGIKGEAEFEIKGSYVQIGSVIAEPEKYEGKEVMIKGKFTGWSIPQHEIVTPMITRSDWIVEDETGAIYVTKLNPEPLDPASDHGRKVIVSGVVRLEEGKPYMEGKSLRII
ncbi:MAG: hypothetical protein SVE93_05850 [Candidatus Thermoplasmatota archaeon]|nr:hypothetical protein [Candidatus Thermoplasmatota archaeon]